MSQWVVWLPRKTPRPVTPVNQRQRRLPPATRPNQRLLQPRLAPLRPRSRTEQAHPDRPNVGPALLRPRSLCEMERRPRCRVERRPGAPSSSRPVWCTSIQTPNSVPLPPLRRLRDGASSHPHPRARPQAPAGRRSPSGLDHRMSSRMPSLRHQRQNIRFRLVRRMTRPSGLPGRRDSMMRACRTTNTRTEQRFSRIQAARAVPRRRPRQGMPGQSPSARGPSRHYRWVVYRQAQPLPAVAVRRASTTRPRLTRLRSQGRIRVGLASSTSVTELPSREGRVRRTIGYLRRVLQVQEAKRAPTGSRIKPHQLQDPHRARPDLRDERWRRKPQQPKSR